MCACTLLISSLVAGSIGVPGRNPAFRVALITPGPISDGGWNQAAYEGLRTIGRELGASVAHAEVRAPSEYSQALRDFAVRGFGLIIGHGFEFGDAAVEVGRQFPGTFFVITSGRVTAKNVASLQFQLNEATYLLGYLAGKMSRTKKVGCVGGMKIPSVERSLAGFVAGARRAGPAIEVRVAYTGSFEDIQAAKESGRALIRWGADFLIHNADASGLGVFQAAAEAKGVLAFGTIRPQHQLMPKVVLASAVADLPTGFLNIATIRQKSQLEGKIYYLGFREGAVGVVFNPLLERRIPQALQKELGSLKDQIVTGRLKVPDRISP